MPGTYTPHIEAHSTKFIVLGIIQSILCFLAYLFGITVFGYATIEFAPPVESQWTHYYDDFYAYILDGVWSGGMFFVSGILSVVAGRKKTRCLVISTLVMSIFSFLAVATSFVIEILAAVDAGYSLKDLEFINDAPKWSTSLGLHSTLAVICFAGLVVSVVQFGYCCAVVCCRNFHDTPLLDPQTSNYGTRISAAVPLFSNGGQSPSYSQDPVLNQTPGIAQQPYNQARGISAASNHLRNDYRTPDQMAYDGAETVPKLPTSGLANVPPLSVFQPTIPTSKRLQEPPSPNYQV